MWLTPRQDVPDSIEVGFFDNQFDFGLKSSESSTVERPDVIPDMRLRTLREQIGHGELSVLHQVHGNRIVKANAEHIQTADAQWTQRIL